MPSLVKACLVRLTPTFAKVALLSMAVCKVALITGFTLLSVPLNTANWGCSLPNDRGII